MPILSDKQPKEKTNELNYCRVQERIVVLKQRYYLPGLDMFLLFVGVMCLWSEYT